MFGLQLIICPAIVATERTGKKVCPSGRGSRLDNKMQADCNEGDFEKGKIYQQVMIPGSGRLISLSRLQITLVYL